jgi:hypothetical protein
MVTSGCAYLGFLLSPGPFEKGVAPAYNLQKQQDRKVMIWVECPHSSGADYDSPETVAGTFMLYLIEKAKFDPENVVVAPTVDNKHAVVDPLQIARDQGVGYLLLVQVDAYEVDSMGVRNYYAGEMVTRALLMDVDLGAAVWPKQPEGKMIHVSVEMETEGRGALVVRLTSAAAHCTLRYLYPCDKLKYKHVDERISLQEAYEIETY